MSSQEQTISVRPVSVMRRRSWRFRERLFVSLAISHAYMELERFKRSKAAVESRPGRMHCPWRQSAARSDDLRREPVLPPGFSLVTLRESGDAFAHACAIAAEAGAATLVWVRRFDTVEFAVVLEPDAPLARGAGLPITSP